MLCDTLSDTRKCSRKEAGAYQEARQSEGHKTQRGGFNSSRNYYNYKWKKHLLLTHTLGEMAICFDLFFCKSLVWQKDKVCKRLEHTAKWDRETVIKTFSACKNSWVMFSEITSACLGNCDENRII